MRVEHKPEKKKPEKFIPPQPIHKVVILVALVISSTALFWIAWHNAISTGFSLDTGGDNVFIIVTTLLAFCLMFSLLGITEILITRKLTLLVMAIVAAGTLFIFFKPSLWSFVAFLIMTLSFLYWRREVRIDEDTRTKFMPRRTISSGLKVAVALVLLAGSFVYYSDMVTGSGFSTRMLDSLTESGTDAAEGVIGMYYGDQYDPEMTLDDFIEQVGLGAVDSLLPEETGINEIDKVIEEGVQTATQVAVDEARESLLDTFNITASGDETMHTVIGRIITKNVEKYAEPYIHFVPAIFAIAIFFVLNILSFIYREMIKSLTVLLFHILVWIKFIKKRTETAEVEKISL